MKVLVSFSFAKKGANGFGHTFAVLDKLNRESIGDLKATIELRESFDDIIILNIIKLDEQ